MLEQRQGRARQVITGAHVSCCACFMLFSRHTPCFSHHRDKTPGKYDKQSRNDLFFFFAYCSRVQSIKEGSQGSRGSFSHCVRSPIEERRRPGLLPLLFNAGLPRMDHLPTFNTDFHSPLTQSRNSSQTSLEIVYKVALGPAR